MKTPLQAAVDNAYALALRSMEVAESSTSTSATAVALALGLGQVLTLLGEHRTKDGG